MRRFDEAFARLDEAAALGVALEKPLHAAISNKIAGALYSSAREHELAARRFVAAREAFDAAALPTPTESHAARALAAVEFARANALDASNREYDAIILDTVATASREHEWEAYTGLGENYVRMSAAHAKLALSSHREALAIARELDDRQRELASLFHLVYAHGRYDEREEALEYVDAIVAAVDNKGARAAQAHMAAGKLLTAAGDYAGAHARLDAAVDVVDANDLPALLSIALTRSITHAAAGDVERGYEQLAHAYARTEAAVASTADGGDGLAADVLVAARLQLVDCLLTLGRAADADSLLAALAASRGRLPLGDVLRLDVARVRHALALSRVDDAREALGSAVAVARAARVRLPADLEAIMDSANTGGARS